MGIKSFLVSRLFGAAIEQQVQQRLPAAAAGGSEADYQWRRLSGNSNRALPVAAWARQVEVCYWLWKTNPLGNWIIETINAFGFGKGFTYTAENPVVKALLDEFWNDPANRMALKFRAKMRELSLFGLQCWPVFTAEQTGKIRLGMIDPAQIRNIYTDPQNAEIQIGVQVSNLQTAETRLLKTILPGESELVLSDDARQLRETYTDGDCFLYSINRVSNDPYGTSDIFPVADWLDEYEELIYKFSGKARKQNAFIWDVELQDADDKVCQAFADAYAINGDGELRVHNQKAKWTAVAPALQAPEVKESLSVFRNHILGNKSIPEHWYGGGGDVNRATAAESNEPFFALIDERQEMGKQILETMFTYVIQSAVEARYLTGVPEAELYAFAVQKPEATNKDLTKIGTVIQQLITSMVAASAQNWLDKDTAIELFAFIIALIGFEVDVEKLKNAEPGYQDYRDKVDTKPDSAKSAPGAPSATKGGAI